MDSEFDWLDAGTITQKTTGLDRRAQIMRAGAQEGKNRKWHCDGEYIWFRRKEANPATLERHNRFVAQNDYRYVETQGDVEIWELNDSSQFKTKKPEKKVVQTPRGEYEIDLSEFDNYNLMRQAAIRACKYDWQAFHDIMTYLRERIQKQNQAPGAPGVVTPLAENVYADTYVRVMEMINQRNGPSPGQINAELMALLQKDAKNRQRIVTFGK